MAKVGARKTLDFQKKSFWRSFANNAHLKKIAVENLRSYELNTFLACREAKLLVIQANISTADMGT